MHTVNLAGQVWETQTVVRDGHWPDEDFGRVEFVSDYEIKGLVNQYHTYGLGVPLIVVRKGVAHNDPADPYYAPGLAFPMTAFLRIEPDIVPAGSDAAAPKHHRAVLELYDPTTSMEVTVGSRIACRWKPISARRWPTASTIRRSSNSINRRSASCGPTRKTPRPASTCSSRISRTRSPC